MSGRKAWWLIACALTLLANVPATFAAAPDNIVAARYADPVRRYGHFAPGPPHEYARIEVSTASGAKLAYTLPETEVFEDVAPRLVRLATSEPIQLLAVVSHRDHGAALALIGIERGRLKVVARSSPIGRPMRWLNPVGVADLDGDGIAEIAAVITPHIGGTLTIYHRSGNRLKAVATLDGFSNHVYGSPELGLSMAFTDVDGIRLVVPDTSRTVLRIIGFDGTGLRETGRCALREPIVGPIMDVAPGEIEVTHNGGRQRLRPTNCRL